MGFWSRLLGRGGAAKEKMTPEEWFYEFGGKSSRTGLSVTQATAIQVSVVMACVARLAEDVAKLPIHVYRTGPKGQKVIATDHPLEKLLRKPNSWQTRFQFVEFLMAGLLLRGNAFACILRDGRGDPVRMVPVPPQLVTLYEAPGGELFYHVARSGVFWTAQLAKFPNMIPAEDMLHIRWLSMNGLTGVSRIQAGREAIGLALGQQQHAASLMGNGARPGGVLTTDKTLSEPVIKRLKADWESLHAGLENAGKTAILEENLKWSPMGMTSVDAEFIASRRFQVEDIARLFGMPLHKIGVADQSDRSTSNQRDQDYQNNVVSGYVERLEDALDAAFDLAEGGFVVEMDVSRFLRADIQTRYNAYRTGIVGMFLTPNEARRDDGRPDIEGGDQLYQPTNVAPLGFEPAGAGDAGPTETGPGSDVTGAPAAGGDGDPAAVDPVAD